MSNVYVQLAEKLAEILASPGGLKLLQVAADPLVTRADVVKAIKEISELAPKPKGNEMAEIPNSLKVVDGKLTLGIPHPTEAGVVVDASFTPEEIISALMLGLQLFGAGKVVLQSRPNDEPDFIKITYVIEGTAAQAMAAARQIYTDVKD